MVYLKLEMTNQATCHPWLLNQEVSLPMIFAWNWITTPYVPFWGTKTAIPGTGWRITNDILPQDQWTHPRYHRDKFTSKSRRLLGHADYSRPWEICPGSSSTAPLPKSMLLMERESREHLLSSPESIYKGQVLPSRCTVMNLCFGARRTMNL